MNPVIRKAIPTDLHSPQVMNFGETHSYRARKPISDILEMDDFFRPCQGRLKAGDFIRIAYVEDGRLVEMQDVIVVSSDPSTGVEIKLASRRMVVPKSRVQPEEPTPARGRPEYRIVEDKANERWHVVFAKTDKYISSHESEDEALQAKENLEDA